MVVYCEPDTFWKEFQELVTQLRNPEYQYRFGPMIWEEIEKMVPKNVSVADVYIPYCYLHPERLTIERMTVGCDDQGKTLLLPSLKHEVVCDLDFDHFQQFLQHYLH